MSQCRPFEAPRVDVRILKSIGILNEVEQQFGIKATGFYVTFCFPHRIKTLQAMYVIRKESHVDFKVVDSCIFGSFICGFEQKVENAIEGPYVYSLRTEHGKLKLIGDCYADAKALP